LQNTLGSTGETEEKCGKRNKEREGKETGRES
jgi:hypothetical protein